MAVKQSPFETTMPDALPTPVFVLGQISIKDAEAWAAYRAQVPASLAPWQGEVLGRGKRAAVFAGQPRHADIVMIRFPSRAAAQGWFDSPGYQALIPLREQAAEVELACYDAQ